MALSVTQQFLVQACRDANTEFYFRWHGVGTSIGLSEAQAQHAVQTLDERKLIRKLSNGDARILDAGKRMGASLETKLRSAR